MIGLTSHGGVTALVVGGLFQKAYRERAKKVHPDVKPGDAEAAAEFQKIQVAYEVLVQAEARREWKG